MKIILASASPRRRELLAQIGVAFTVRPSEKEEKIETKDPEEMCRSLSAQKAKDIAWQIIREAKASPEGCVTEETRIIGADTVVAAGGEILGKPKDAEDAKRMLRLLSGRTHEVWTGVTVVRIPEGTGSVPDLGALGLQTFAEKTDVTVAQMSEAEIAEYAAGGEASDKAGAYGIQGGFAKYIVGISGDYNNVVGLPVGRVWRECLGEKMTTTPGTVVSDFTTMPDRHGMDAMAVDLPPKEMMPDMIPDAPKDGTEMIPMWVADMNFKTAPSIPEAIIARAKHPAYGYFVTRPAYYESIIRWQTERNGVTDLSKEDIGYENGVLGCVASALQAFTAPGEAVLLHSPTYVGFSGVLRENGREAVLSELAPDKDGIYRMDYDDMDRRIKEKHIHLAILCSPHNPSGRVWTKEELEQAMEVYRRNEVVVISDEIWSDLILSGHRHIPTQSISEDARRRTIAVYAPSKTFNLAGLIGSYHIIYDPYLRDRVRKQSALSHYNSLNVLSQHALIGAYSKEGEAWLDGLRKVLTKNAEDAVTFFRTVPGVACTMPEGTYMIFPDFREYCAMHKTTMDAVLKAGWDVGVAWQDGRPFHGAYSIRLNLALPNGKVREALGRLAGQLDAGLR